MISNSHLSRARSRSRERLPGENVARILLLIPVPIAVFAGVASTVVSSFAASSAQAALLLLLLQLAARVALVAVPLALAVLFSAIAALSPSRVTALVRRIPIDLKHWYRTRTTDSKGGEGDGPLDVVPSRGARVDKQVFAITIGYVQHMRALVEVEVEVAMLEFLMWSINHWCHELLRALFPTNLNETF